MTRNEDALPELDRVIGQMFVEMNAIHSIVETCAPKWCLQEPNGPELTLKETGHIIGAMLKQNLGGEGGHSQAWLSKKAYDSVVEVFVRPVMAGINAQLDLPEDYRG